MILRVKVVEDLQNPLLFIYINKNVYKVIFYIKLAIGCLSKCELLLYIKNLVVHDTACTIGRCNRSIAQSTVSCTSPIE